MEPRLADAIGDYLHAHIERHGRTRTAAAFGVSRHTLWRFLERSQAGRALPAGSTRLVAWERARTRRRATQALPRQPSGPAREGDALHSTTPVALEEGCSTSARRR